MRENLLVTKRPDGVADVVLNRPDVRNALDGRTFEELAVIFAELDADATIRVIVLSHAAPTFCAGADLKWLKAIADNLAAESAKMQRAMLAIDQCGKLVVAAVDGPAFAGGLGLLSSCDVVIATKQATFCLSEVKLGMAPAITTAFLLRRIGPGHLRYLGATAAVISAERAFQIGLINHLVADKAGLDAEVAAICQRARDAEPAAVAAFKRLVAEMADDEAQRHVQGLDAFIVGRRLPSVELGLKAVHAREKPPWARNNEPKP